MSQKQNDANNCYMDSVRVKISEKYKPPPKITLAMTYAQRLTLNRQLQESMPNYKFETDVCVKENMREWRTARQTMANERKQRLDQIRQDDEQRLELEKAANIESDTNRIEAGNEDNTCNERLGSMLIPTQANILTPIPLAPHKIANNTNDASPINISDFEPDSSSPFDNLELKTLNDMEELKIVLQNDDKNKVYQPQQNNQTYAPSHNSYYNYMPTSSSHVYASSTPLYAATSTTDTNGYASYYANTTSSGGYAFGSYHNGQNEYAHTYDTTSKMCTNVVTTAVNGEQAAYNSVPDIIKSLQNQLNLNARTRSDVTTAASSLPTIIAGHQLDNHEHERLENPYANLPKHSQAICDSIAMMGFPLPRVSRACKVLGDDEKKIVEYLLSMSQLMDVGFSEDKVASALCSSDNDRDKALEMLIT